MAAASRADLEDHLARKADLGSLSLADGVYDRLTAANANFGGLSLFRSNFQDAVLPGANLAGAYARRSVFTKADLSGADLRQADFTDAQLNAATLTDADARGCQFSEGTNLNGAKVAGLKIDRRALRMLGPRHGGLNQSDLASLSLYDDQIKLATSFGGFWSGLHAAAVVIFILPYVVYAVRRYIAAQLAPCIPDACITLREAIWQYIASGGNAQGGTDHVALGIFFLLLLYNVFRGSLVFKTRALSLAESASGIPTQFSLRGYWLVAYYGCLTLVWLNLALVLSTAHAFSKRRFRSDVACSARIPARRMSARGKRRRRTRFGAVPVRPPIS